MKVALVYDRVNKWGGAERVLLALHKIYPEADLYTSVYNREGAPWAEEFSVKTTFLQKLPFASSFHDLLATFMPLAFESFNFDGYDLVISVTSEAAKGIITKPGTLHICICLTPTRYLWSGYNDYFKNPLIRFLSKPAVSYLRYWDKIAANRPDSYLAISTEVKKRIKKYYGLESGLIPLAVADLGKPKETSEGGYYLIVSRLVYYKRIDIAVEAFNKLNLPLKIIGTGSEKDNLKRMANNNIEFLGEVAEGTLGNYYANCRALIFPGIEDFGLVMVEAQSFGKPVIAFRGGGALDIIKEGVTGEFFDVQSAEALEKAMEKFQNKRYNAKLCTDNSKRFSFANFKNSLLREVDKGLKNL